ncbi:hypothetical protein [Caudoviricetes sp.]|nr:hypothetical protein [Caudoviricetes sp.]
MILIASLSSSEGSDLLYRIEDGKPEGIVVFDNDKEHPRRVKDVDQFMATQPYWVPVA